MLPVDGFIHSLGALLCTEIDFTSLTGFHQNESFFALDSTEISSRQI